MKIKSLRLTSYGKFKNKEIVFSDGMNIVTGNNESGKSTVMSFIQGMLYGFSGRGNDISKNERKKYIPWDGEVLAGEMNIETSDGRLLTLIRKTGKTQAKDEYTVIKTATGETAEFDAEKELGISEAGFKNTVFIKQSGALITGESDEISDKLISLLQSGDEGGGYYKAAEALTNEMRRLKLFKGNGGIIYDLNCKIAALSEELAEISRYTDSQLEAIKTKKELAAKIDSLTAIVQKIEKDKVKAETQKLFVALQNAKNKKSQSVLEYENTKKIRERTENELAGYSVFKTDADEIIFAASPAVDGYEDEIAAANRTEKKLKMLSVALFSVAVVAGIAAIFYIPSIVLTILCAVAGIIAFTSTSKQKKLARAAQEKIQQINSNDSKRREELAKFGCSTLKEYTDKKAEFTALSERYKSVCDKMAELVAEMERAEQAVADTQKEIKEKFGELSDCEISPIKLDPAEEARVRLALDDAVREYERLEGQLAAERKGMRTFDVVEAEKMEAQEQLAEAQTKYAALELAKKTLDTAYENISKYFSPALSEKASKIFGRLTGGDEKILSDKKFAVTLDRNGLHDGNYFSCGTAEQVYLSLRIAIIDIVLGETTPIIMDDSFTAYDSTRLARALEILREMSNKRQIIVFSCREITDNTDEIINL